MYKIPVTCKYWKLQNCRYGAQCKFHHEFLCSNDGVCTQLTCQHMHFKQKNPPKSGIPYNNSTAEGTMYDQYHKNFTKVNSPILDEHFDKCTTNSYCKSPENKRKHVENCSPSGKRLKRGHSTTSENEDCRTLENKQSPNFSINYDHEKNGCATSLSSLISVDLLNKIKQINETYKELFPNLENKKEQIFPDTTARDDSYSESEPFELNGNLRKSEKKDTESADDQNKVKNSEVDEIIELYDDFEFGEILKNPCKKFENIKVLLSPPSCSTTLWTPSKDYKLKSNRINIDDDKSKIISSEPQIPLSSSEPNVSKINPNVSSKELESLPKNNSLQTTDSTKRFNSYFCGELKETLFKELDSTKKCSSEQFRTVEQSLVSYDEQCLNSDCISEQSQVYDDVNSNKNCLPYSNKFEDYSKANLNTKPDKLLIINNLESEDFGSGIENSDETKGNSDFETNMEIEEYKKLGKYKDELVAKVKMLIHQRNILLDQKEDLKRKNSNDSFVISLQKENSAFIKEVESQIGKFNNILKKINSVSFSNEFLSYKKTGILKEEKFCEGSQKCGFQYPKNKKPAFNTKHNDNANTEKNYEKSSSIKKENALIADENLKNAIYEKLALNLEQYYESDEEESKVIAPTRYWDCLPVDLKGYSQSGEQEGSKNTKYKLKSNKKKIPKVQCGTKHISDDIETKVSGNIEYSPSPDLKPFIKYADHGMHWCSLCSDMYDCIPSFVQHLLSKQHVDNTHLDDMKWLVKPPKLEKEIPAPNQPVIDIPVQGVEFLHSCLSVYCSLCDIFLRNAEEASLHPRSKIHVLNYKNYLSKNPLYEAIHIKKKMTAYGAMKAQKEREKIEVLKEMSEALCSLEKDLVNQNPENSEELGVIVEKDDFNKNGKKLKKLEALKSLILQKPPDNEKTNALDKNTTSAVENPDSPKNNHKIQVSVKNSTDKQDFLTEKPIMEEHNKMLVNNIVSNVEFSKSYFPLIGKMPFLKCKKKK